MASYAAVMTLMDLMVQIQRYHSRHQVFDDHQQTQLQSLREKVSIVQDFLETNSNYIRGGSDDDDEIRGLESRIADAAYAAEDIIESYIVDDIHARSKGETDEIKPCKFSEDIEKVIGDFDTLMGEIPQIIDKSRVLHAPFPQEPEQTGSSRLINTAKDSLVGCDEILPQIIDKLTGHASDRQVIVITGMGGIGKSTLAKKVYENQRSSQHFDVCGWVTVSQEFNVQDFLLGLLKQTGNGQSGLEESDYYHLGEILYKRLLGRRYLIVIDDVWSLDAWDRTKLFLPEDNNKSRIIVTTRLLNLASDIGSCHIYKVNLLDKDKSWNLLRRKVFDQESCPVELEEVGKMIARNCKGLPLSLVVISGILKRSLKLEYWKHVNEDVSEHVNSECNEHVLKILRLSYSHLYVHLKPCFLCLGVFPEDRGIQVSLLKKLWIAEGFLKPKEGKTLEEVASDYFKDLLDRNLILIQWLGDMGKVKFVLVHDLVRDFCLKEARKERFLYVCKEPKFGVSHGFNSHRRLAILGNGQHISPTFDASQSTSFPRSFLGDFCVLPEPPFDLKLLKVWKVRGGRGSDFHKCIEGKVNLQILFF